MTEFAVTSIDRHDVLFVISDAPSMGAEQAVLRRELPAVIHALAASEIDGMSYGGLTRGLHVAVVSASLADGVALHRVPAASDGSCAVEYPSFLHYSAAIYPPAGDDLSAFERDFQCLADVGSQSTGPSQPLEAALRVLSDPSASAGFLRNDPTKGLSLITIVVVTDADDCSVSSGRLASGQVPSSTAACVAQTAALQSVDGYVRGLKALRTGNENLVELAVIAGFPPQLVDAATVSALDLYSWYAVAERDTFYRRILDDPAMQFVPDPSSPGRLMPVCMRADAGAEPARRLLAAAQGFGPNARVASICSDDWPATLASLLLSSYSPAGRGRVCLPRRLERRADGRVECKLIWELPPPDVAEEGTPSRCSERPFLSETSGKPSRPGGARCELRQAAITSDADLTAADPATGWYYDDFSTDVQKACTGPVKTGIGFTDFARTPSGVTARIECFALQIPNAEDGATASPAACNAPPPAAARWGQRSVGRTCMPAEMPDTGFDDREVWIETAAADCAGGMCMAYKLRGDPWPGCVPSSSPTSAVSKVCSDPHEVAERLYCTRRCDTRATTATTVCPHGFSCRDIFTPPSSEFPTAYCVKDGT